MADCGEATAVWCGPQGEFNEQSEWMAKDDLLRMVLNAQRSMARSKSAARRYAVQNLLVTNWTLTWEGEGEFVRSRAIARVNRFLRELRVKLGGAFPYLYVLEVHPGGHGYHVHLLLDDRFIDKHELQRLWGGIVWFSRHNKGGHSQRSEARIAIGYLMKYLTKDWEAGSGQHRYERSVGFNVAVVRRIFRTFREAEAWLAGQREQAPLLQRFDSETVEDWHGPPVLWMAW